MNIDVLSPLTRRRVFANRIALSAGFAALILQPLAAHAQSITLPTSSPTVAGQSNYPFGTAGPPREQFFYGSSLFSGVTSPITITSLTFTGTLKTAGVTSQTSNITILGGSTTIDPLAASNSATGVNTTFYNNLNPSVANGQTTSTSTLTALSNSNYTMNATLQSGSTYTATISLTTPIVYDPTAGRALFLDISDGFTFFGTNFFTNSSLSASRLYGTSSASSTTAVGTYDKSGIPIVTLNYTTGSAAAPEPDGLALTLLPLAVGALGTAVQRRRRRLA